MLRWCVAVGVAASMCIQQPARAADGVVAVQAGGSVLAPTLAFGVEGGVRFDGHLGLLAKVDVNPWLNTQESDGFEPGALNIGIGGEVRYFDEHVRSAVFVGPSILLFDTPLDEAGTTGMFVDLITVTLRFPLNDVFALRVDPATVHVVMPVLTRIPLIQVEYRHTLAGEVTF